MPVMTTKGANTRLTFRFVDASNYKAYGEVVFAGTLTGEMRAAMEANLNDGEFFLPGQLGLSALYEQFPTAYEDDHPWHAIESIEATRALPTDPRTAAEFAHEFATATWDEPGATAALERWAEDHPRSSQDD